jgi:hypothetical protein
LHRGRRTCPSRRVWLSNSDPGAPERSRTTCRHDGRTRAPRDPSRHSRRRDANGSTQPGGEPALRPDVASRSFARSMHRCRLAA